LETTVAGKGTSLKAALHMMINPGGVFKNLMNDVPPILCFSVSGLAFTFFFLQTGLDLWRAGLKSPAGVVAFALIGTLYGTVTVALVATVAWAVSRPLGGEKSLDWALRAFTLSYCPALIYALLGLLFNMAFGWNTSIAFGVTGMLWALMPLVFTAREMLQERLGASMLLAAICGGLLLFGWALITT
jgi:hypothetical protein